MRVKSNRVSNDPRAADSLDDAARNSDGTYNGARALSWLSDVLTGGKGLSEQEVAAEWNKAKQRKANSK